VQSYALLFFLQQKKIKSVQIQYKIQKNKDKILQKSRNIISPQALSLFTVISLFERECYFLEISLNASEAAENI
jgi:hypothetical protein